jgi:hypothetical protein
LLVQQVFAGPARRGAEILSQVRRKTLVDYWPADGEVRWYIARAPGGKPVAWRAGLRNSRSQHFSGQSLQGDLDTTIAWGRWQLRPDASAGRYHSLEGLGGVGIRETQIVLHDGQITVTGRDGLVEISATAAQPDNYIPEGMFSLVVSLVNKRRETARFKMIFDSVAIEHGKVMFVPVTLTPQGHGQVRADLSTARKQALSLYHLDESGQIVRIDDPSGLSYLLADMEQVLRSFPKAGPLLSKLFQGLES